MSFPLLFRSTGSSIASSLVFTLALALGLLWPPVRAAPALSRVDAFKRSDANLAVLQFAGILEQLERQFYAQALAKFTPSQFTAAGFVSSQLVIDQLNVIASDEATHITFLEAAIASYGAVPEGAKCQFDFTPALADVNTMVATARTLELVGVSAYLGGAPLLTDRNVLSAAGGIVTVEARHSSLLNTLAGGRFQAAAFDAAIVPQGVLALAGGFLKGGCDVVGATGITPFPDLQVMTSDPVLAPGSSLSFTSAGGPLPIDGANGSALFCQMVLGGAPVALAFPIGGCAVPEGVEGPVYIYVTSDATPLQTNVNQQDVSKIKAGPALVFVDPPAPELLAQALKNIGASVPSGAPPGASPDPAPVATATTSAAEADPAPSSGAGANPGQEGSAGSGDTGATVLHMPGDA